MHTQLCNYYYRIHLPESNQSFDLVVSRGCPIWRQRIHPKPALLSNCPAVGSASSAPTTTAPWLRPPTSLREYENTFIHFLIIFWLLLYLSIELWMKIFIALKTAVVRCSDWLDHPRVFYRQGHLCSCSEVTFSLLYGLNILFWDIFTASFLRIGN